MSQDEEQYHEIKKIAVGYRVLCGFVLLVSLVGMAGVIGAILFEPFHFIAVVAMVVCFLCLILQEQLFLLAMHQAIYCLRMAKLI